MSKKLVMMTVVSSLMLTTGVATEAATTQLVNDYYDYHHHHHYHVYHGHRMHRCHPHGMTPQAMPYNSTSNAGGYAPTAPEGTTPQVPPSSATPVEPAPPLAFWKGLHFNFHRHHHHHHHEQAPSAPQAPTNDSGPVAPAYPTTPQTAPSATMPSAPATAPVAFTHLVDDAGDDNANQDNDTYNSDDDGQASPVLENIPSNAAEGDSGQQGHEEPPITNVA